MRKKIFKIILIVFIINIITISYAYGENDLTMQFSDVPGDSWAFELVHQARSLNITQGSGNNVFGFGQPVKRNEFVKLIISIMGWDLVHSEKGTFADNQDTGKWYYDYIETAFNRGVIEQDNNLFRPEDYITRGEMAAMIVNGLGYNGLAAHLSFPDNPFKDVKQYEGYINIAKDLGIITGKGNGIFDPEGTAKREEAIAMIMRLYNKINSPLGELHAFYAINSFPQMDFIDNLTSVSFGWSRLQYDDSAERVILNTGSAKGNDFYIPEGFSRPVEYSKDKGVSAQLMVFASQEDLVPTGDGEFGMGLVEYILSNPERRTAVIQDIADKIKYIEKGDKNTSFDGVTIDFELLKGKKLAELFNEFLRELRDVLGDKKLYVAVHPKMKPGFPGFDGYDYVTIGSVADRVILMAHDYGAVGLTREEAGAGYNDTPLAPLDDIYYALKGITDSFAGIADTDKIWLQVSFDSAQWQKKDGRIINQYAKRPYYESIYSRLLQDAVIGYSETFKYPWATFFNKDDNTENIIWYEDSRSVMEKVRLAKMFGINGISLWRLGNIPAFENPDDKEIHLDVWQQIKGLTHLPH